MNKIITFPNEAMLRESVGLWIARLDRGLTSTERAELSHWLNENDRHRGAFLEMAELWDRMDILNEIAELFPLQTPSRRLVWLTTRPVLLLTLLIAAIVPLVVWQAVRLTATPARSTVAHRGIDAPSFSAAYQTAVGEQRVVTLPDQSHVTLNTATRILVAYTASDRKLELQSGEAHFEVKKDVKRVFSVRVGLNEFNAVGTVFDIRVNSDRGIQLTVTEGRVRVRVPSATQAIQGNLPDMSAAVPTEIMVDAGKEVAIDKSIQTVETLQPARMDAAVAWTRGMMVFDAEPLEKAIREVSRYSTTRFIIAEESSKNIPVSGYFKVGDTDGLVAALRDNFDIDAKRQGNVITLSSRRK
jgi:transmembrane sensor